ncbi:MAG: hypothetical protein L0H59_18065 [Tomitella sp.]|nr:hypothetical protein [Tomitella sp.]
MSHTKIDDGAQQMRKAAGFGWPAWDDTSTRSRKDWRDAALTAARYLRTHPTDPTELEPEHADELAGLIREAVGLAHSPWRHGLCEDQHRWINAAHTAHHQWHALRGHARAVA